MRKRGVTWTGAVLLVAVGCVAAGLLVELAVRIATHSLFTLEGNEFADCCTTDPMVGRLISRPGTGRVPKGGFTISIGERGGRLNGDTPPRADRPLILAVGDSFAFGDGVDDADTWPAVLERLSGGRVINAGMIAFGLDQAVLRAEQLVGIYAPDTIVVAFIPHDVERCEMSYWSGFAKPYFDLDGDGLRLHPAVVSAPPAWSRLKRLLSYSLTFDLLFPTWLHWEGPEVVRVHEQGREVACRLMERLAALGRSRHARIVVVAYPQQPAPTPENREIANGVLACAAANGLPALDLFAALDALPPAQRQGLFDRHYTVEGNRWVGTALADFLVGDGSPPRAAQ